MKKRLPLLYCILFVAACAFFAVGAFLPTADTDAEGRDLAPFPAFRTEEGWNPDFFTELDTYVSEHFTARQSLIRLNGAVKEKLFKTGTDQVIVGRDGFLFYAETAPDFMGESLLTDEEINTIADEILALSDYAAEHGATLLFTIAPNKNTVYGDRMPARYPPYEGVTNTDALYAALEQRGVLYADLRDTLSADAEIERNYHKRDTHWNGRGALVAYREILSALGTSDTFFADCGFVEVPSFAGDLDEMLYPGAGRTETDFLPDVPTEDAFIYTSAYVSPMDMTITTVGGGEGRLLMFRDSFGSALIPYFSAAMAEVRYERATPYRIDILNTFDADFVVIEIAERNISTLLGAAERIGG